MNRSHDRQPRLGDVLKLSNIAPVLMSVAGLFYSGVSTAEEYSVVSATVAERAVADGLLASLEDLQTASEGESLEWRVARRLGGGEGVGFVVRVDGVSELHIARDLAERLTVEAEAGSIYAKRGRTSVLVVPVPVDDSLVPVVSAVPVEVAPPADVSAVHTDPAPTPPEGDDQSTTTESAPVDAEAPTGATKASVDAESLAILLKASRAHAGEVNASTALAEAGGLSFEFRRRVVEAEGEVVAHHRYVRQGAARRVEILIESGKGISSTTILTPEGKGWLVIQGVPVSRDPQRVREVTAHYAPRQVLAILLQVAGDLETSAEWQQLRKVGEERAKGGRVAVLEPGGVADERSIVSASFYIREGTLASLTLRTDKGKVRFHYQDYQATPDKLILPSRILIEEEGTLAEDLEIIGLALEPELQPGTFATPKKR